MPSVRRKYLSPDEARRLIEAGGKVGRQSERDKLMLTLMYRHGLRVSEVIDLRWTDFDLDAPRDRPFYVRRLKGSKDTCIPWSRILHAPCAALGRLLTASMCFGRSVVALCRQTPYRPLSRGLAGSPALALSATRTCCAMPAASFWPTRELTRA